LALWRTRKIIFSDTRSLILFHLKQSEIYFKPNSTDFGNNTASNYPFRTSNTIKINA
jgi:hypothetical protein